MSKKFLIIGNMNAITYKEVFPLIKDNKLWTGHKNFSGGMDMIYSKDTFDITKVKKYKVLEDGNYLINVMGVIWFTNMDVKKRHEDIILYESYYDIDGNIRTDKFPTYDNYDAINVDKVVEIPKDYYGYIGVPITFIDKYNPEQFEIIGLLQSSDDILAGIPNLKLYNEYREMRQDMTYTGASGGKANGNPVLNGKSLKSNFLYNPNTGKFAHSLYARILIKRK